MRLYLLQHGDAVPEAMNRERPLSEKGRVDLKRLARFVGWSGFRAGRILHSGKLRARQSAELMAAENDAYSDTHFEEDEDDATSGRDPLEAFATYLIAEAAEGRIDPLIGREQELERTLQVLCRRRKNNRVRR